VALIGHLEKLRFSPIKHTYLFDKQRTPFEENEFFEVPSRRFKKALNPRARPSPDRVSAEILL